MANETHQTYRERLFELAQDRHGFVTTDDARELGIPTIELRKLAHRGKLVNVSRGVYKFPNLNGSQSETFLRALLEVGPDAFLVQESVLAFHGLASVNPRFIKVGTRKRVRKQVDSHIHVVNYQQIETNIQNISGLKLTRLADAILESKQIVMKERLLDALIEGIDLGLITSNEEKRVRAELNRDA